MTYRQLNNISEGIGKGMRKLWEAISDRRIRDFSTVVRHVDDEKQILVIFIFEWQLRQIGIDRRGCRYAGLAGGSIPKNRNRFFFQ